MAFLPKDEKEPEMSDYLNPSKIDGSCTFRVLSSAITGQEYWKTYVEDGEKIRKPIRVDHDEHISVGELEENKWGNLDIPRYFWAFVVWNHDANKIQIMSVTQKKIRSQMKAFINNEKWGEPKEYDITLTKTGEGLETEYTVVPNTKDKLDEGILKMYEDMGVDLQAWKEGKDTKDIFAGKSEEVDPKDIPL